MKPSLFSYTVPEMISIHFEECLKQNDDAKESGLAKITVNNSMEKLSKTSCKITQSIVIGNIQKKAKESISNVSYPFFAKITQCASFSWEEGTDTESIGSFLKITAPALIYTSARPIFLAVTSTAKNGPYELPLIDFTVME